jgi:hypothetical protein
MRADLRSRMKELQVVESRLLESSERRISKLLLVNSKHSPRKLEGNPNPFKRREVVQQVPVLLRMILSS